MKFLKTLMITFVLCVLALSSQLIVEASEVNSDEELLSALRDSGTESITLNYQNPTITEFVSINRNLKIEGNGAVLTAKNGVCLTFAQGTALTLRDVVLTGERDFIIKSHGSVALEGTVEFAGGYGILLNNGGALNSYASLVSRTGSQIAIAANPNGGEVTVNNLNISDTTTKGILLYVYRGGGSLRFMGSNNLSSTYGTAIFAPGGKSEEQKVIIDSYAVLTVSAENAKVNDEIGAAVNIQECALELKRGAQLNVKGSYGAVYCDTIKTEADCAITASSFLGSSESCAIMVYGKIAKTPAVVIGENNTLTLSGSGMAVYRCKSTEIGSGSTVNVDITYGGTISSYGGSVKLGDKVTVKGIVNSWGIYAKEGFSCGTDCDIMIDSESNPNACIKSSGEISIGSYSVVKVTGFKMALETEDAVKLNEYATLDCESPRTAIYTGKGVQTAKGCLVSIKNAERYGIYSTGTLLANTVSFGEGNTVSITSKSNGIYSCEAVIFNKGCEVDITSGKDQPAIWVNTSLTSQGYMRITGSRVNISSGVSAESGEAAVNVVGSVIVEDKSTLSVSADGFGIFCRAGDFIVGTDSKVYAEGGCAAFVDDGNIRISQGGGLFAKGTLDSGVRITNGMLHIGKESSIITEGERFGAEILKAGGIWIENPKLFDFRSTTSAAIYIEEGVFNAADTETLSGWYAKEGKTNKETWWNTDVSNYKAWEINTMLSDDDLHYADYTQHNANGTAYFLSGAETSSEGFTSNVGEFYAGEATRISAFKTRPIGVANYLFIPAGRAFSWTLEASSVEGEGEVFEIIEAPKSGTATLNKNGILSYKASESTRGEQTIVYKVTGIDGAVSLPTILTVNVTRSKPPAAYNHTFDVKPNGSLIDNVTATDFDGVVASITVTKQPEHGKISLSNNGTINYKPEDTYVGIDSFCYVATDNDSDQSNEATVTLLVGMTKETNARNATLIAGKNEETKGTLKIDLPKNTQLDRIEITNYPKYGTVSVEGVEFTYSSPENFAGTESFSYVAINQFGIRSNEATVSIITVPSEKPKANALKIDCAAGKEYSGKLSAQDLDGKITTYMIEVYPEHGELTFDPSNGKFTYKSEKDFIGADSFSFYVYDDEGLKSEVASVSISVETYLNILKASGDLTRIIVIAVISALTVITLTVLVITGTIRKRRKQDREFEEQYGDSDYYMY